MRFAWAFNPFDNNPKLQNNALRLIKSVAKSSAAMEAVYVASPRELELATAFDVPENVRYSQHPKNIVQKLLKNIGLGKSKATVLKQGDLSLTSAAKKLSNYLSQAKVDLTLVATYARKGNKIFTLGSFAETLVHYSKTDLLVFSEHSKISSGRPKSILFAHDLSASGDKGLERAMAYAKEWKATLNVLHVPDPSYGFKVKDQDSSVVKYRELVQLQIGKIEAKMKKKNVKGSVSLETNWDPIADLIIKRAKKVSADMVMVTAKAGRLAAVVGGSVTRQMLRASHVPVLVAKTSI
jgi:nucleotide-binding universal stress UspA family protein